MGIVMQAQRRAIEDLEPKEKGLSKNIRDTEVCLSGGRRIYVIGVSAGRGTCSDVHGMDVLVFAAVKPLGGPRIIPGSAIETCQYAVLLRVPTKKEAQKAREYLCATSLLALELLAPVSRGGKKAFFRRTGKVICYSHFV